MPELSFSNRCYHCNQMRKNCRKYPLGAATVNVCNACWHVLTRRNLTYHQQPVLDTLHGHGQLGLPL